MSFKSLRERIIDLIKESNEPLSVDDIIRMLDIESSRKNEIYDHLSHIAKTVRQKSKGLEALLMIPPVCKSCGYVFKDLEKPKRPSKCPKCKSERIEKPKFKISRLED